MVSLIALDQKSAWQIESTAVETSDESAETTHTDEDEKKLLRKIDRTLLPCIMLMYCLSYMDRYERENFLVGRFC
jgi:hypothetical protein